MPKNKNKQFIEDYDYRLYRIKHFGKKYGWKILSEIDGMIFGSKEIWLRIDPKKMTVETELIHPKRGETKLIRHGDFTMNLIEKIFCNPRVHTPQEIDSQYVQEGE